MKLIKDYISYILDNPEGYWFKAKWYGWGWVPATRHGWFVTIFFTTLIILNSARIGMYSFSPEESSILIIFENTLLVLILLAICYKKGEKTRWNWGKPKK